MSTRLRRMPAVRVPLKYSAMKREVEKAMGMHMIRARIEVITVPAINGSAPYSSLPEVGFQTVDVMNPRPYSLNAGIAPPARERTIPAHNNSIISDETNSKVLVTLSPFISLIS
jgi:hypothetical protein